MDPYSQALLNFHKGIQPDIFEIKRDDGYSSVIPISIFFDDQNFSEIEVCALRSSNGKILDIGAGAGRHSSELQRRGFDVAALDKSEQAINIMMERGISKTKFLDILELTGEKYDTLLLLMNGIGMVGDAKELDYFLNHIHKLLNVGGALIVDSIDVLKTNEPLHVSYREQNILNHNYPGQQNLQIHYNGESGKWFKWLHLTYEELSVHASKNNFLCSLLTKDESGHYLAKLQVQND